MKYIKLYEEYGVKPVKKFPTEPAVHYNYIIELLKKNGLDPYNLGNNKNNRRDTEFGDFCFKKCSGDNIVFPNKKDNEIYNDFTFKEFIFGENVFLLPNSYDSSNDFIDYEERKNSFFMKMIGLSKKSEKDEEKFIDELEKNVNFGAKTFDWVNPALEIIYNEFKEHYKDGKLRIWMPQDGDYEPWVGYDYPHKYNVVSDLDRPDGVYFLSDIEKYIEDKYGIKDESFYDFILKNEYIEGRYWERVWSLRVESKGELKKSNFGKYGMEPTKNILDMLNIIEHEFKNEINKTKYEGFPIYVDYYKKNKR